jgi:hypothetical protein
MGWEQGAQFGYRLRRYLANATDAELVARMEDIAANVFTFTPECKIGMVSDPVLVNFWRERMAHAILESGMRGRDPLNGFDPESHVFTTKSLGGFRIQPHILSKKVPPPVFCRYGRAEHLVTLRESGEILLRAGSYYSSKALDAARRDDELVLRTYICPHDYDLGVIDPFFAEHRPQRSFGIVDNQKPADFYLYCVTASFEVRMFADFKANACLIIKDQIEFERKLMEGVRKALPGWFLEFGQAKYLDPYNMPQRLPNVGAQIFFCKHCRYMYQAEYRLVALPPNGINGPFAQKLITIGSLESISELVTLNGDPFGS